MGILMVCKPTYNWGPHPVSGWWYTYPYEKYEKSVGMMTFPIYETNKNIPNHQPIYLWIDHIESSQKKYQYGLMLSSQ